MRFKSTWAVIAVFAALAAYLFFVDQPRYEAKQEAEKKEGLVLPDLDTDKITELTIEGEKGKVRVKKGEDDKWFVVEPWDDQADGGRVRTLLSDLKNLRAKKEVAPADADMEPFGLKEPECVVRTAGVEVTLEIGAQNPVGDSRYIRVNGGPVRVAKSYGVSGFLKDPVELRNKEVLGSFPWSRLESVEIRPPEGDPIRLVKKDERWYLAAPFEAEADPDAADRVADKLRWARVGKFLDEDPGKAEEKLGKGLAVVLRAEGDAEPVTVRMALVDGTVWADRTGRKALFTVPRDVYEVFRVTPEDLRRKKPVLTKTWKVKKLELTLDGRSLAYEKVDGKWQREGRGLSDNESAALQDLLRSLAETEADEVIGQPGGPAGYGLDAPVCTATLVDTEGGEQTLALGEKGDAVYARAGGEGPVYRMPRAYLESARALVEAVDKADAPADGKAADGKGKKDD